MLSAALGYVSGSGKLWRGRGLTLSLALSAGIVVVDMVLGRLFATGGARAMRFISANLGPMEPACQRAAGSAGVVHAGPAGGKAPPATCAEFGCRGGPAALPASDAGAHGPVRRRGCGPGRGMRHRELLPGGT